MCNTTLTSWSHTAETAVCDSDWLTSTMFDISYTHANSHTCSSQCNGYDPYVIQPLTWPLLRFQKYQIHSPSAKKSGKRTCAGGVFCPRKADDLSRSNYSYHMFVPLEWCNTKLQTDFKLNPPKNGVRN